MSRYEKQLEPTGNLNMKRITCLRHLFNQANTREVSNSNGDRFLIEGLRRAFRRSVDGISHFTCSHTGCECIFTTKVINSGSGVMLRSVDPEMLKECFLSQKKVETK
jgi:hypothetical protein